ncbi:MAG: hypothetical protein KIT46_08730 [Anaerolineales bacterium]|nr:hypothetical protein [Anaerolineales bacterium]MCW5856115.1 hypothetical protein [Anaerolineales bacterium]
MKMLRSRKAVWSALLALMLLLAACGGSPAPAEEAVAPEAGEATSQPLEPAEPEVIGGGQCANEYYPVAEGATWTYAGTGSTGDYTWTASMSGVSDNGFTLTNTFNVDGDTVVATQQWSCTNEGVAALQFGGGPEASVMATGVDATFETTGSSGYSFPNTIHIGDTWQQSYNIQGVMNMADGLSANTTGLVTHIYTAQAEETVTVPAGEFQTIRILVETNLQLQVELMGVTLPFSIDSQTTSWLARNVGWVRSDSGLAIEGGEAMNSVVEMQSYHIP